MQPSGRDALVRAIGEDVQRIGLASERLGHVFADSQSLHPTDFRALSAIFRAERQGRTLTGKDLAAQLQLSPAAITYVVDRLVESGHVERERDPADRRRVVLRYSDPGREVAVAFFGPLLRAHGTALAGFADDDLAVAGRVLSTIVAALDDYAEGLRTPEGSPSAGGDTSS